MGRVEFMKELAFLLQDLPQEEKSEALQYYNSYFFDAGEEKEKSVIEELGSPERIAAIVRSELSDSIGAEGEYTETGYQDFRFKAQKYEVSAETEKEKQEQNKSRAGDRQQSSGQADQQTTWSGQSTQYRAPHYHRTDNYDRSDKGFTDERENSDYSYKDKGSKYHRRTYDNKNVRRTRNPWKTFAIVMIAIFLSPVWVGLLGVLIGLICAAIGLLVGLAAGMIGCLVAGIAGIGVGIFRIFSSPLVGMLTIATALISFGLGCIFLILVVQIFRRLLPWLLGLIKSFWGWIVNRGGRRA